LCCLLAVASASTSHALSEITTVAGTLTVTATWPDNSVAPVLVSLTYPTTYDSSATTLATFGITGSATYTGNNTVQGGWLVLTNGADTVRLQFYAIPAGGSAALTNVGLTAYIYPKFLNTGSYSASVTLLTDTFGVYSGLTGTTAVLAVAATAFVPQVLAAFNVVNPQSAGCDATSCSTSTYVNATASFTPTTRTNSYVNVYFRPTTVPASGAMFTADTNVVAGAADFNDGNNVFGVIGGVIDGMWTVTDANSASSTLLPTGATFALSASVVETQQRNTWYSESTVGAFQSSVVLNPAGTADTTSPTCTVASIAPIAVTTDETDTSSTLTLTCSDAGSGIWLKGAFAQTALTTGSLASTTVSFVTSSATTSIYVPAYISGTLTIIGVFAVDNAGNAALYGSCGSIQGFDSIGCAGGGSSDASSVTVSLFAMVLLAIFALCC